LTLTDETHDHRREVSLTRHPALALLLLVGCTGGQHYADFDGGSDGRGPDAAPSDARPDAYVPDADPAGPLVVDGQSAEIVLGQPDFNTGTANTGGVSAHSMEYPTGIASDGTYLWVVDGGNERALRWEPLPNDSSTDADMVLGRPSLTDNASIVGVTLGHFSSNSEGPHIAISGTTLVISDTFWNRVLIWNPLPTTPGQAANIVLGQTTTSGYGSGNGAGQLFRPRGVWTDGTRLVVADAANNRVLIWTTFPTSSGESADLVLGQSNFGLSTAPPATPTASSMSPFDVHYDGTRFYVTDGDAHRVMVWNGFPSTTNEAADYAIGQPDLTTDTAGTTASSLRGPSGIAVLGDALFIADSVNDRVMIWQPIPTASGGDAAHVLGVDDFITPGGTPAATQESLNNPLDVVVVGDKLYVTDNLHHRVLRYGLNP